MYKLAKLIMIHYYIINKLILHGSAASTIQLKSWPPKLKNYDIWGSLSLNSTKSSYNEILLNNNSQRKISDNKYLLYENFQSELPKLKNSGQRDRKVLNFFPVPVDDECLSDDGRRAGICLNVYECRIQNGMSRGQCAVGFGVCCVFTATCDENISNNITYIISPGFPALMSNDVKSCKIIIKLISSDISQLRLDFVHFSLGQPNRRTGICDGDTFSLKGGTGGDFVLCGQNNGQHMYYDVPYVSNNSRMDSDDIELFMNFTSPFFLSRFWEIRVTQIPFSQRAPAGCLQYFSGEAGIIQTFNFAENGRHLANQNYRACIRQEIGMCSIVYEQCHEQSFKIGPNPTQIMQMLSFSSQSMNFTNTNMSDIFPESNSLNVTDSPNDMNSTSILTTVTPPSIPNDSSTLANLSTEAPTSTVAPLDDDDDEGSGDDSDDGLEQAGFFSLASSIFSRSLKSENLENRKRSGRQYFSSCTDRITMPCVVEDFIAAGMGTVPDCYPIHCGTQLCPGGSVPCRIESTVTPFSIGVHFGDGIDKGSPEDNIGACLRYNQMACVS